ncbi:MAG: hypothetical protein JRG71_01825 [Deltaproteobacteria bacterium]|nr:hypothetical protein [Deltaproteobacteria bacterium]
MALSYARRKFFNAFLNNYVQVEYPLPEGATVSMRCETHFKKGGDLRYDKLGTYNHCRRTNHGKIRLNLMAADFMLVTGAMMPKPKAKTLIATIAHEYKHALQRFYGDDGAPGENDHPREVEARAFEKPAVDGFLAQYTGVVPV